MHSSMFFGGHSNLEAQCVCISGVTEKVFLLPLPLPFPFPSSYLNYKDTIVLYCFSNFKAKSFVEVNGSVVVDLYMKIGGRSQVHKANESQNIICSTKQNNNIKIK